MKNIKTNRKMLWLLTLAMLCSVLLIGCGGGEAGVSEIFVQQANMPRLTYVQGEELDLYGGVLTAVVDGVANPIPMSSEEVSVTGYNKDQLGKQTLTITYRGKTTTIEVNVVARIAAEDYEVDYFVGAAYDNSKGRLRVLKDNGSQIYVNLNSPEVTLKSFDSSKAGEATVTVVYDGEECAFTVTVHEVANIRLKTPNKTKYASHETELSLNGGYLTVEAASPSTFSKHVPLTAEMVSGYDPSQVTYENRDQVTTQTITVSYGGKQTTYDVQIAYSDVHLVQYLAQRLNHLDWTQQTLPELTENEKADAVEAIKAYLDLTPLEKESVDETTLHAVLFAGTWALRGMYLAELDTFSKAFGITSDGRLALVGESYEDIAAAIVRLEDEEDPFNQHAALLMQINEELGDTPFQQGKVSDMILAHNAETAQSMVNMFRYMLNLHDLLKDIPEDWTVQTLEENDVAVANVISKIIIGEYSGVNYNQMYKVLSSWRAKDDFCDIIYTFYTYIKVDGMEELQAGLWQSLPLPGPLNDWYVNFMQALQMEQHMIQNEGSTAYLYDTAGFMYYYSRTLACAEQVKESGNELYNNLYRVLNFEYLFEANLRSGPKGYLYLMAAGLDSEKVLEAWDKVLVLLDIYLTKQGATYEEYAADFRAVFDAMVDMTPSDLYAFVSTINFLYSSSKGTVLVLECQNRTYSTMMTLLRGYYINTLPENVFVAYCDLLLAMENYSLRGLRETAVEEFKSHMESVTAAYQAMSAEEKAAFDNHLGKAYSKYMNLYSRLNSEQTVDLGQHEAKIEELFVTLQKFDELMGLALSGELTPQEKTLVMPVVMALYEKARMLYDELATAGEVPACELAVREYVVGDLSVTLEFFYSAARNLFVSFMLSAGLEVDTGESYMLWELYGQSAIRPVLARMADLLLAEYNKQVYQGTDVGNLMVAFRVLTPAEKNTFFILGINQVYYAALERYFCTADSSVSELVPALLKAEIAYAVYMYSQEDEAKADFLTQFKAAMELYQKLENKDQIDVNIRQMYALYEQAYKDLSR